MEGFLMNEIIISILLIGIVLSGVKWAQSLKKEQHEVDVAVEQEGMIYMERLEEERKRRNHSLCNQNEG